MADQNEILIVDDTPANLQVLSQLLREAGYKVRAAASGFRALMAIGILPPDLILLDIKMPEMDGYELCRRLKTDSQTRDIPIIFISALNETEDKVKAFALGGVDYITKPFQAEEVLARIQTHLTLRSLQQQLQESNHQLERRLQQLAESNAELSRLNADLKAFAATVAHDLKNPAGVTMGIAQVLETDHTDMAPEEVNQYLHRISVKSREMVNIINELLLLAEVREKEVEFSPLDMAGIVAKATERLDQKIQAHQAVITCPPTWPIALGYAPWIEEVWVNYLSNAIKYGGQPPQIELGATPIEHQIRFWISDNGPGLSEEEQNRLFTPFVRLHETQATGYGLGLSLVRRIMEKLGGEAGVESNGLGSRFFFTLPGQNPP